MICRATGCHAEAMPTGPENPKGLCGACHETNETRRVRLKPGPKKAKPESIAKGRETRRRNAEAKEARRAAIREGLGLPPLKGAA